jgi:hypothetical protein
MWGRGLFIAEDNAGNGGKSKRRGEKERYALTAAPREEGAMPTRCLACLRLGNRRHHYGKLSACGCVNGKDGLPCVTSS